MNLKKNHGLDKDQKIVNKINCTSEKMNNNANKLIECNIHSPKEISETSESTINIDSVKSFE